MIRALDEALGRGEQAIQGAAELRAVADAFGADYDVTITDEGVYEVIHTAHLYAIDDEGLLQVTWPFGTEPDDIARDLQILLRSQ